jgi:hypothetical protein
MARFDSSAAQVGGQHSSMQRISSRAIGEPVSIVCRTDTTLECKESAQCHTVKHHYDECVERVTGAAEHSSDKKHADEDCVEECKYLKPNNRQLLRT